MRRLRHHSSHGRGIYNLTGKDVDLAATKPGYTQEAVRRTEKGVFAGDGTGRDQRGRRGERGERRPQLAYKKGLPSRSKIPPTRSFLYTPRIRTSHLSKAILTTV